jgi:hypothetical protein
MWTATYCIWTGCKGQKGHAGGADSRQRCDTACGQVGYEVRDGYYVIAADGVSRFDSGDCAVKLQPSFCCDLTRAACSAPTRLNISCSHANRVPVRPVLTSRRWRAVDLSEDWCEVDENSRPVAVSDVRSRVEAAGGKGKARRKS